MKSTLATAIALVTFAAPTAAKAQAPTGASAPVLIQGSAPPPPSSEFAKMAMPVERTVKITLPSQFEWTKNPNGSDMALLKGNFSDVGVQHVFRVKWPKGMKMMPHTHPDERTVTVMSGSYGFAEGSVFDPAKLKPYPTGTMIVVPAGVPHFGGSEEGAEFQEMGMSPTSTDWIPQPAEVRQPATPPAPARPAAPSAPARATSPDKAAPSAAKKK